MDPNYPYLTGVSSAPPVPHLFYIILYVYQRIAIGSFLENVDIVA